MQQAYLQKQNRYLISLLNENSSIGLGSLGAFVQEKIVPSCRGEWRGNWTWAQVLAVDPDWISVLITAWLSVTLHGGPARSIRPTPHDNYCCTGGSVSFLITTVVCALVSGTQSPLLLLIRDESGDFFFSSGTNDIASFLLRRNKIWGQILFQENCMSVLRKSSV